MLIYVLLVMEILLLNMMRTSGNISRTAMCRIVAVSMILVTGLRSVDVGADTTVYYIWFEHLDGMTLADVWNLGKRDFGYYILAWIIHKLTGSFTVLTLFTAIVFYWPLSILIDRYSDDCGLSYLVLMAFNFFQFSMTGIRQTLALGFSILFCLELLRQRPQQSRALIWLLIAITMHRSSLLMLAYYGITKVKSNRKIITVVIIAIPIVFVTRSLLLSRLLGLFSDAGFELLKYQGFGGGLTTFLIYLLLFIGGAFFANKGKNDRERRDFTFLLTTFGIATVLQIFVMVNSIFFRIVWYFAIFMILHIPKVVKTVGEANGVKPLLNMAVYICILYMYFFMTIGSASVLPYSFA